MSDLNFTDGGPAYPNDIPQPNDERFVHPGMSLRDYFAGQVIAGIFAGKWAQMPHVKPEEAFANTAYVIADAMLKRRDTP